MWLPVLYVLFLPFFETTLGLADSLRMKWVLGVKFSLHELLFLVAFDCIRIKSVNKIVRTNWAMFVRLHIYSVLLVSQFIKMFPSLLAPHQQSVFYSHLFVFCFRIHTLRVLVDLGLALKTLLWLYCLYPLLFCKVLLKLQLVKPLVCRGLRGVGLRWLWRLALHWGHFLLRLRIASVL